MANWFGWLGFGRAKALPAPDAADDLAAEWRSSAGMLADICRLAWDVRVWRHTGPAGPTWGCQAWMDLGLMSRSAYEDNVPSLRGLCEAILRQLREMGGQ